MKAIGIQLKSKEAIIVVLTKTASGEIVQIDEGMKLAVADIYNPEHIRQFRDQIKATFDSIKPDYIGICKRNENGSGRMAPAPASFKLEGIIHLYDGADIKFVAPQTISTFLKKSAIELKRPRNTKRTHLLSLITSSKLRKHGCIT